MKITKNKYKNEFIKNNIKKCRYCIISITMEMTNDENEIIINDFFK